MRTWTLLVAVLSALSIAACDPQVPQPGVLQDFDLACDKVNEGQWIAVEGYLRLPDSFNDGKSVELRLYPTLAFTAAPIGVPMLFGDGPDQAEHITGSYHDNDLKVHLADGHLVPFGTRVRVSGRMVIPILPQEYTCELQNTYVEAAK